MKEKVAQWIEKLEAEWSEPEGFLWKVRQGIFDEQGAAGFIKTLESIELQPSELMIDRRLVALIWYVPLFLSWQKERIAERGGDIVVFAQVTNRKEAIVTDLLGAP